MFYYFLHIFHIMKRARMKYPADPLANRIENGERPGIFHMYLCCTICMLYTQFVVPKLGMHVGYNMRDSAVKHPSPD